MRPTHILMIMFLSVGLASASGSGPKTKSMHTDYKQADKQADKAEKKNFKQHLKAERAACKHHPHTVACNDIKERQRIEKRQFKANGRS
ncbi:MAG TPA: hypothetical protein VG498_26280 [Terriglobales bacterium]|nr:hypothetical protein [Terriglobales bacterium]